MLQAAVSRNRAHRYLEQLLAEGYCIIPELIDPALLTALEADLAPTFEATPFCQGSFYGERTKRFGSLLRRSRYAAPLVQQPLVLEIVDHVLKDWCDCIQLNLTQAIEIHPGAPEQFPHRDQDMWQGEKGRHEYLVNVIWPLTPFTKANGATIIYPRTHGRRALGADAADPAIVAECAPGSAILFLGSTLHGAGANRSQETRRAVITGYSLGWLKPYENQWLAYPPAVARTFSPALAALVGYRQHRPNLGNFEGQCPSILLRPNLPAHIGAIDALRPDQALALSAYVAAQEASASAPEAPRT